MGLDTVLMVFMILTKVTLITQHLTIITLEMPTPNNPLMPMEQFWLLAIPINLPLVAQETSMFPQCSMDVGLTQ